VPTTGKVETRATKSASSGSNSGSSDARVGLVRVGELEEEVMESAGVGCKAGKERGKLKERKGYVGEMRTADTRGMWSRRRAEEGAVAHIAKSSDGNTYTLILVLN
jgi:hypothetical protein